MKLPLYQVDAFTDRPFTGNPAAVCPLDAWLPDDLMQKIAAENNLSETAFFVRQGKEYRIRWFTPAVEIDLCGHATLASGWVLYHALGYRGEAIRFLSASGPLTVREKGDRLELDFPASPPRSCPAPELLARGLGREPLEVLRSDDYLVLLADQEQVRTLAPDFRILARLDCRGIIVTAPGTEADFVSRFFAPGLGIDEDPVTGSAHCTLTPFWAKRLGRNVLKARQLSSRGGELECELHRERVLIRGMAVLYLAGTIRI
ncbi:MAG TPA: PhzF family phenazine biosynthesis protein [Desulfobulbus sp.]|nr:PhzF family phenazine biosynthesis protein [Desulfobulbus sp.]